MDMGKIESARGAPVHAHLARAREPKLSKVNVYSPHSTGH